MWLTLTSYSYKLTLPHLNENRLIGFEIDLEVRLRASFTININTTLLDHAPRFSHRRHEPKLNQKLRQLPRAGRERSLFNIFRRLLVTKHRIELFLSLARFSFGIK